MLPAGAYPPAHVNLDHCKYMNYFDSRNMLVPIFLLVLLLCNTRSKAVLTLSPTWDTVYTLLLLPHLSHCTGKVSRQLSVNLNQWANMVCAYSLNCRHQHDCVNVLSGLWLPENSLSCCWSISIYCFSNFIAFFPHSVSSLRPFLATVVQCYQCQNEPCIILHEHRHASLV